MATVYSVCSFIHTVSFRYAMAVAAFVLGWVGNTLGMFVFSQGFLTSYRYSSVFVLALAAVTTNCMFLLSMRPDYAPYKKAEEESRWA